MQNYKLTVNKIKDFSEHLSETNGKNFMQIIRDLIAFDPFNGNKFYIYSFIKLGQKTRYHQPRLTKPELPVPGTTLLRVDPMYPDEMKMCWTLPPEESLNLCQKGKAFADEFVYECVQTYKTNAKQLVEPEGDELPDERCRELYKDLKKRLAHLDKLKKSVEAHHGKQASNNSAS